MCGQAPGYSGGLPATGAGPQFLGVGTYAVRRLKPREKVRDRFRQARGSAWQTFPERDLSGRDDRPSEPRAPGPFAEGDPVAHEVPDYVCVHRRGQFDDVEASETTL